MSNLEFITLEGGQRVARPRKRKSLRRNHAKPRGRPKTREAELILLMNPDDIYPLVQKGELRAERRGRFYAFRLRNVVRLKARKKEG